MWAVQRRELRRILRRQGLGTDPEATLCVASSCLSVEGTTAGTSRAANNPEFWSRGTDNQASGLLTASSPGAVPGLCPRKHRHRRPPCGLLTAPGRGCGRNPRGDAMLREQLAGPGRGPGAPRAGHAGGAARPGAPTLARVGSCGGRRGDAPRKQLPVVAEEPVAQHEPPPLVALDVIGPFEEPALASRARAPGARAARAPRRRRGSRARRRHGPGPRARSARRHRGRRTRHEPGARPGVSAAAGASTSHPGGTGAAAARGRHRGRARAQRSSELRRRHEPPPPADTRPEPPTRAAVASRRAPLGERLSRRCRAASPPRQAGQGEEESRLVRPSVTCAGPLGHWHFSGACHIAAPSERPRRGASARPAADWCR